ncbi:MAG: molecular chaperone DnaJ [Alphaproteobacteria bacterium]|nr:molecular chaperone DnaJ [Alphaproteobacteria bacterium]MBQ3117164.1 molecular chaperone DnaJ [Alphaproteobacteria bacterium]
MAKKDYYDMLGVSKDATASEIKRAFRQKAKECHPDVHPGDAAAEVQFKEINEAYEILKDEQKRAAYDRYGHAAFANGNNGFGGGGAGFSGFDFAGSGFENIFEEMFRGFGGASRSHTTDANTRGADVRYDVSITLQEAFEGVKKSIVVNTTVPCEDCGGKGGKSVEACPTCGGMGRVRQRQGFFIMDTDCPDCHGTGKTVKDPCSACKGQGCIRKKRTLEISIPKGVETGVRMRLSGEGDAGIHGGPAGDLYVFVTVKKHSIFDREGIDLYCEMPVPMTTAALGGKVAVPTMTGKAEEVEIKAGMQSGTQIKIKGKGMPRLKSDSYGDMYVTFRVETPTHLSAKQKELLQQFAAESKDTNQEACSDFLCQIKKIWNDFTS